MRELAIFLLVLSSLGSCTKMEGCVKLEGSYRLWIVSAGEKFISRKNNVYWLGPRIESMAIIDGYIVGKNPKFEWNSLNNISGYFIIDTKSDQAYIGLEKEKYEELLKSIVKSEFELVGPSSIFKQRKKHLCS